jgi:hypothetical protein
MKLIFTLAALMCFGVAFSQPIQMHKTLGGAHFQRDTIYLSHSHVLEILSVDPEATNEFKMAIKDYRIGGTLGFAGAILLAIPVVTAIAGGDPEWLLAGGGAVLIGISVPFSRGFKQHSQAALDGYNMRHEQHARRGKFYFNGNAVGIRF